MSNNLNNFHFKEEIDNILNLTEDIKLKINDNEYKKMLDTLKKINDIHIKFKQQIPYYKYKIEFIVKFPICYKNTIKCGEKKISQNFINTIIYNYSNFINYTMTKKKNSIIYRTNNNRAISWNNNQIIIQQLKKFMKNALLGFETKVIINNKIYDREITISIKGIIQRMVNENLSDTESEEESEEDSESY